MMLAKRSIFSSEYSNKVLSWGKALHDILGPVDCLPHIPRPNLSFLLILAFNQLVSGA